MNKQNPNWEATFINHFLNISIKIWKTRNKINNMQIHNNQPLATNRINSQIKYLYYKYQNKILGLDNYLYKKQYMK